jgi:hypothetical protein
MAVSMWVLTAYFALGVLMNGISRSRPERLIMTPTALVLAALYLILAAGLLRTSVCPGRFSHCLLGLSAVL